MVHLLSVTFARQTGPPDPHYNRMMVVCQKIQHAKKQKACNAHAYSVSPELNCHGYHANSAPRKLRVF